MRHTNETKRKVEWFRDLKRVVKGGGEQEISHVSSLTERERVGESVCGQGRVCEPNESSVYVRVAACVRERVWEYLPATERFCPH